MATFTEDARRIALAMGVTSEWEMEILSDNLARGQRFFVVRDGSGPIIHLPRVIQSGFKDEQKARECLHGWSGTHPELFRVDNRGEVQNITHTANPKPVSAERVMIAERDNLRQQVADLKALCGRALAAFGDTRECMDPGRAMTAGTPEAEACDVLDELRKAAQ